MELRVVWNIRSYHVKLPFLKLKTIYFRNYNIYSIKIWAISFNDVFSTRFPIDAFHFYRISCEFNVNKFFECCDYSFSSSVEYFIFLKTTINGETRCIQISLEWILFVGLASTSPSNLFLFNMDFDLARCSFSRFSFSHLNFLNYHWIFSPKTNLIFCSYCAHGPA